MKKYLLSVAILCLASGALAQHAHSSRTGEGEIGQSQFAAIAEIVALLRADPGTDWSKVDIGSLRDHLVDMDNVLTKAAVEPAVEGLSATFSISGDAVVGASIQRMVLAHAPLLAQATGWSVAAAAQESGATMTVTVRSPQDLAMVTGLGFFGLLTIGAHHREHHLMMAKGRSPH